MDREELDRERPVPFPVPDPVAREPVRRVGELEHRAGPRLQAIRDLESSAASVLETWHARDRDGMRAALELLEAASGAMVATRR